MRLRHKPTSQQRSAMRARLPQVQQPEVMLKILRPVLPADFVATAVHCAVPSVHSDRFVIQARVHDAAGGERSFALKAYSDDFGGRVWTFAQTLARHQPANHDGFCLPTAYLAEERLLIFPWVDGKFLSDIVDERKPGLLRRAARLAAGLHRLRLVPDDLTTAHMFVEEARARCDRLRRRWPQTAELIEPLTAALEEALPCLDPADPAPIQGDLAAGQFLWTGTQLVLLDLDMFGYADPAYDAGHFLAQLERRCLLDPTVRPHAREWLAAFRDTYLAAMPEVSPRNVSFYQGLTLVRKIYTICRRQPVEGPQLAPLLAGRARAALEAVRSLEPAS
jgi:hypothetical protein